MSEFGSTVPSIQVPPPGPRSRALSERLGVVEAHSITYTSSSFPVFWEAARGANVRDVDGNVYVDLTGAFGVAAAGHGHPNIAKALSAQAGELVHGMGDVHPTALKVELLERLQRLSPWTDARAILASTGSEAVEIALKTALLATGRPGILAFQGGYHGLTMGALSATARDDFRAPFRRRLYGGVRHAPFPVTQEQVAPALAEIDRHLDGSSSEAVGAVIVEPIQGRAGVRIPAAGFLPALAERVARAGSVLVFDEVFTGFGRTGWLFGHEADGVVPDLLCVGKALGGGLPLSACIGHSEVMDAWPESRGEALHTSTFLGHPLACAMALSFLDVLEEEELVARSRRLGDRLVRGLQEALSDCAQVREVRGRGLLVGIELATGGDALEGCGASVAVEALRRGILVLPAGEQGEVVELSPPLVITEKQLDVAVLELAAAVRSAHGDRRAEAGGACGAPA